MPYPTSPSPLNATPGNISSYRQFKPSYIIADLQHIADVPAFISARVLMARGVFKSFSDRRQLIKLIAVWGEGIAQLQSHLHHTKQKLRIVNEALNIATALLAGLPPIPIVYLISPEDLRLTGMPNYGRLKPDNLSNGFVVFSAASFRRQALQHRHTLRSHLAMLTACRQDLRNILSSSSWQVQSNDISALNDCDYPLGDNFAAVCPEMKDYLLTVLDTGLGD